MKRTGFNKKILNQGLIGNYSDVVIYKPRKPLKRSKLKKKSKAKISTIQNKLWELCKQIVRKKYPPKCYTCDKRIYSKYDKHTGHVPWPKASLGAYLKYDLRILKIQCYSCNIFKGGMGAEAYIKMLKEIGQEEMEKLQKDRQVTVNAYDWYTKLIGEYEGILAELNKTSHIAL